MVDRKHPFVPFKSWPDVDQVRWTSACDTSDIFAEAPARWSSATKLWRCREYSSFLGFLRARFPDQSDRPVDELCCPNVIKAYIEYLRPFHSPITIFIQLDHLHYALEVIHPAKDWKWLARIGRRLKYGAVPKLKPHVSSEQLYCLGVDLMDGSVAPEPGFIPDLLAYRDGFQIALLSDAPIRRRAFAALDIDKHLVRDGNTWTLFIPEEDSKTKTETEYPIRPELVPYLERYLQDIRPLFPRAAKNDWLWPSLSGRRLGADTILTNIKKRTRLALGFEVSIHAFRRAAATLWAERDPANVRGSADLLGHRSLRTTQRHYNMARARLAGRAVARTINSIKLDLGVGRKARRKRKRCDPAPANQCA